MDCQNIKECQVCVRMECRFVSFLNSQKCLPKGERVDKIVLGISKGLTDCPKLLSEVEITKIIEESGKPSIFSSPEIIYGKMITFLEKLQN